MIWKPNSMDKTSAIEFRFNRKSIDDNTFQRLTQKIREISLFFKMSWADPIRPKFSSFFKMSLADPAGSMVKLFPLFVMYVSLIQNQYGGACQLSPAIPTTRNQVLVEYSKTEIISKF